MSDLNCRRGVSLENEKIPIRPTTDNDDDYSRSAGHSSENLTRN